MKRKSILLISLVLLAALLSSCGILAEMMQGSASTQGTPAFGSTTVKPTLKGHDDNDKDGICDNCGGHFVDSKCMGAQCAENGEHVWSEYKYNERAHWREYICGHDWPEIVEEHMDTDEDRVCDVCGCDLSN